MLESSASVQACTDISRLVNDITDKAVDPTVKHQVYRRSKNCCLHILIQTAACQLQFRTIDDCLEYSEIKIRVVYFKTRLVTDVEKYSNNCSW